MNKIGQKEMAKLKKDAESVGHEIKKAAEYIGHEIKENTVNRKSIFHQPKKTVVDGELR